MQPDSAFLSRIRKTGTGTASCRVSPPFSEKHAARYIQDQTKVGPDKGMTTADDFLAMAKRYQQAGALTLAEQAYRQAVQAAPDRFEAWFLLAGSCQAQGRFADAIVAFRRAAQLHPTSAETQYLLGNLLAIQGQFPAATVCYREVVRLQPAHFEALNNLGVVLAEQRQIGEALECYHRALALKPEYAEAHYNLGNAHKGQGSLDAAIACYRKAIRLRPAFAEAHVNLGIALASLGKPAEAVISYQEAVRLRPNYAEAYNNLGLALAHLGQHEQALMRYQRALELRPDFPDAHYNRSLTWLSLGDYARGWPEYEWRWRLAELPPRPFSQPLWDGTPLPGRTILLHNEQGMGDTIQFIRFAPLVKQRGLHVVAEVQAPLVPLLASARGVDVLLPRGASLPAFDVHCPLMSLVRIFAASPDAVPADVPYLSADPARVQRWREELSTLKGFKIGIAWQGSPSFRWDRLRSLPLTHLAPLARLPGVRLVSLQKEAGAEQLTQWQERWQVLDLGSRFASWADTAAALVQLDLVVSVDTAIAHLAGALGLPVWVPLWLAPEWRWLLHRPDSPWYPTMRLFRQTQLGDWDEVFARMAAELRQRLTGAP
jgi:tetratricopeptide (TPR) repeat protein